MDILGSFKKFRNNSRHVLSISYKPTSDEFSKAAKLIIFGILLIGVVGFIIAIVISLIITGSFTLI